MQTVAAESLTIFGYIYSVVSNQHGKSKSGLPMDAKYFTTKKTKIMSIEGIEYPNGTCAYRVNKEIDFPIGLHGPGQIAPDEKALTSKFYPNQDDAETIARMLTQTYLDKVMAELDVISRVVKDLGELKESYEQQINNSLWAD